MQNYTVGCMYEIDDNLFEVEFNVTTRNQNKSHVMQITKQALQSYEGVSNLHYVYNGDIVVIRSIRLFSHQSMYRKASQMDYDKWMNKKFPKSVNAAIYRSILSDYSS